MGQLLPGTPGTLKLKRVNGRDYWYRVFYSVPGKQEAQFVCAADDAAELEHVRHRIEHHAWIQRQVSLLRKIGFQVADKAVARVLVELHNQGAFDAGLVLVGTLAYMCLLNELGGCAISSSRHDIDLVEAQGPQVAVLAAGERFGRLAMLPVVRWDEKTVPHLEYLVAEAEPAGALAGGHCIPVRIPQAGRYVWHTLYSSTQRCGFPSAAARERLQALTVAALLAEQSAHLLVEALESMPAMMREAINPLGSQLTKEAEAHSELVDIIDML